MTILIVRAFFIILCMLIGRQFGFVLDSGPASGTLGALVGAGGALVLIGLEFGLRNISSRGLSAAVFGLLFGLILSQMIIASVGFLPISPQPMAAAKTAITVIFCYFGMIIAMRGRDEFNVIIPYVKFARQDEREDVVLLDTSVIIDGRISDICQTKFVEGRFVIPRFVLKELQQIADSSDAIKRNRGRRGLDILGKLQKTPNVDVKIHEEDFPDLNEVDAKLVKLAKVLGAKVLTNDYNLNKVAELQGVRVLNINELANALKPVVLPGELLEIRVIKEGKEYNQGVAYLDDGTMVVVENGRSMIGQSARVLVTSVLQTAAGRMIFAKPESNGQKPAPRASR
ncbi:MAG: PIN domain nuclease [Candidatus Omnitrophica bacterium]|nr:PIN domain nuclease [Candidatus Omnitrophota bacterium]